MAKIRKKVLTFDQTDLLDIVKFKLYYSREPLTDESPFVEIPVVSTQTQYDLTFPDLVPVVLEYEGEWNLGIVAVDDEGNESDMDVINPFFDFVAPAKPVWRR